MYTGCAYSKLVTYQFDRNKAGFDRFITTTLFLKSFHEIGDSTILRTTGVSFILKLVSDQMREDGTSAAKPHIFSKLSKYLMKMIDLTSSVEIYKRYVPESKWVCGTLITKIQTTHERAQHYLTEMLKMDLQKSYFNESKKDGLEVECLFFFDELQESSSLLVRVLQWMNSCLGKDWNSGIDFSVAFVPLPNEYTDEFIECIKNIYNCNPAMYKDFNEKFEQYKSSCREEVTTQNK